MRTIFNGFALIPFINLEIVKHGFGFWFVSAYLLKLTYSSWTNLPIVNSIEKIGNAI